MTNYDVGYGKPPTQTQFKPGKSGNPKGRAKGNRNIKSDLMDELNQKITINENGKSYRMSKQQVFLKQLCAKAISGNISSGRLLATFMMKYFEEENSHLISEALPISISDQDIINNYIKSRTSENEK